MDTQVLQGKYVGKLTFFPLIITIAALTEHFTYLKHSYLCHMIVLIHVHVSSIMVTTYIYHDCAQIHVHVSVIMVTTYITFPSYQVQLSWKKYFFTSAY